MDDGTTVFLLFIFLLFLWALFAVFRTICLLYTSGVVLLINIYEGILQSVLCKLVILQIEVAQAQKACALVVHDPLHIGLGRGIDYGLHQG